LLIVPGERGERASENGAAQISAGYTNKREDPAPGGGNGKCGGLNGNVAAHKRRHLRGLSRGGAAGAGHWGNVAVGMVRVLSGPARGMSTSRQQAHRDMASPRTHRSTLTFMVGSLLGHPTFQYCKQN